MTEHKEKKSKKIIQISKLQLFQLLTIMLAVGLVASLALRPTGCAVAGNAETVGQDTIDFINVNFLPPEVQAQMVSAVAENGLYKVTMELDGQQSDIYISGDGKLIFPTAIDIDMDLSAVDDGTSQTTSLNCDGVDTTIPEPMQAHVVSYCPYGMQMQRIIETFPDELRSEVKIMYIGGISADGAITSMHGQQEADENHRQICIREEQSDKFWGYVGCFMKEGDTAGCLTEANIDTAMLDSCMADPKKGVEYARQDFCIGSIYGVSGSPTLIFNGENINEGMKAQETGLTMRSAELVKTILCEAVDSDACATELYTEAAAASFSTTYDANGQIASGSC